MQGSYLSRLVRSDPGDPCVAVMSAVKISDGYRIQVKKLVKTRLLI